MVGFLSLVRNRLNRNRDLPISTRLKEDALYAGHVAFARVALRDCTSVGKWVRVIGGAPRVENEGHIEIGERCKLHCSFAPMELRAGKGAKLVIGARSSINFGVTLDATREVRIGSDCGIGPYCIISDTEAPSAAGDAGTDARGIEIGNGVWLASRVTVLPGSRIGDGSVITAGSVVAGEIPPGVVAGGTPARVLRRIDPAAAGDSANGATIAEDETSSKEPEREESRSAASPAFRGLLIADFTLDELARAMTADASIPVLGVELAPFGQVIPTLMGAASPGFDFAVVWTRPETVSPAFARLLDHVQVDPAEVLEEVDQFAALLARGLSGYRFAFVPTWVVPPWHRGSGVMDAKNGVLRVLSAMNARLIEKLSAVPNVFVLNAQSWVERAGKGAHSQKLWYMGKVPFAAAVFEEATADIKAGISGLAGGARKLLIVDLDDTLWGGIVGDAGWENLRLGGHDSVGEAFADFQRAIKALTRRGIVLGIVSKNEESVALEAIAKHPEMVLRLADFVGHRINWQDKARNVADLASSLNLGLQSVVFIDDNPFERARVRDALPEVYVPEWPEDKLLYPSTLLGLRCFDAPLLTREDAARTEMYSAERERDALRTQLGSVEDWLRSLDIRVKVEPLNAANLARATQLLNKTNQLNLTTRRLTESELSAWVKQPGRDLFALSVSDRLGDAGLTGLVSLEARNGVGQVVDFVLSCRVMGRKVEETMVHLAVDAARRRGLQKVVAQLLPTAKNKPCQTFLEGSGLAREELTFTWNASEPYSQPDVISLERTS